MNTRKTNLEQGRDGYQIYPASTLVARRIGPMSVGRVTEPTDADMDRCLSVHGMPGKRAPMVLVAWATYRTWEYTQDLRPLPESNLR